MTRIDRQRRQDRIDLAQEIIAQALALGGVEVDVVHQANAMLGQLGQDVFMQTRALDGDHVGDGAGDQRQLHVGRPTIQRQVRHTCRLLALETTHALAEILVEVARRDSNEFESL